MPSRPQIAFGVRITNSPLKIIMNKDLMSKEQSPRQDFKEQEESKQIELFNSSERWRKSSPRRKRPLLIHTKSSNQTGDDSPLMMSPLKLKKKSYNETKSPQRSVTKRQKNFYESVQTSMIIEDDDFVEIKKEDIVLIEEEKTMTYKRRETNFKNEIIDDETVKYNLFYFNPYYGRSRESLIEESDLTLPQQRILASQNSLLSTDKLSCMIIKTNHLDQIQYYPENETRIIYYKDSRILHHSILKDFQDEMDKDLIVKRATMNQVLVESCEKFPKPFESPNEIENFLKKFSKAYQSVFSIQQIGRGGESVVYRLQTQELDEIVAKCPILKMKENFSSQESLNFFQSTLYENQLLKVKAHSDFTAKIKEEVIEYNKDLGLIIRYVAIIEQAQNDLSKLTNIWCDQNLSIQKCEKYSDEKLAYYCFQSMKAIDYLHSKNIYYGDMKPENLLIFRNQQVKIGDFGISIKLYKNHKNSKNYPNFYKIRGYTRQYSLPYIQKPLCLVSKPDLYLNDRFGLWKTFHDIYHLMKLKKLSHGSELLEMMINDLDFKKSKLKLHEITLKYIIAQLAQFLQIKIVIELLNIIFQCKAIWLINMKIIAYLRSAIRVKYKFINIICRSDYSQTSTPPNSCHSLQLLIFIIIYKYQISWLELITFCLFNINYADFENLIFLPISTLRFKMILLYNYPQSFCSKIKVQPSEKYQEQQHMVRYLFNKKIPIQLIEIIHIQGN